MMDDYGLILNDTKIHNIKYLYYQFIPDKHQYLKIEDGAGRGLLSSVCPCLNHDLLFDL